MEGEGENGSGRKRRAVQRVGDSARKRRSGASRIKLGTPGGVEEALLEHFRVVSESIANIAKVFSSGRSSQGGEGHMTKDEVQRVIKQGVTAELEETNASLADLNRLVMGIASSLEK